MTTRKKTNWLKWSVIVCAGVIATGVTATAMLHSMPTRPCTAAEVVQQRTLDAQGIERKQLPALETYPDCYTGKPRTIKLSYVITDPVGIQLLLFVEILATISAYGCWIIGDKIVHLVRLAYGWFQDRLATD